MGRETLRTWMLEAGPWASRKQRKTFHQPRVRRESHGELAQIDGSEHRWFKNCGEPCTLLVFIDDSSSKLMQLRFVPSESTQATSQRSKATYPSAAALSPSTPIGTPSSALCVRTPRVAKGMTQFGRALEELNIEIRCANSSQAKGRVERANAHCRTDW